MQTEADKRFSGKKGTDIERDFWCLFRRYSAPDKIIKNELSVKQRWGLHEFLSFPDQWS